jgi:hypothetical protein
VPRTLIAVVAGIALTVFGYGVFTWTAERYLPFSPENKIIKAFPLPPELRVRLERIAAFDDIEGVRNFQELLEVRLRLRALNCATAYVPAWYDSIEAVKKQASNTVCFTRQDLELGTWISLMEVGLLLRHSPLRPIPTTPASTLRADAFIHDVSFATRAGIGLFHTRQSIQVLDIGSGEVLFSEPSSSGRNVSQPSANGRLFAESEPRTLSIKETETGRTLLEVPDIAGYQWVWLDQRTAVSLGGSRVRFVDFSRGQFIQTELPSMFGRALAVPGKTDHYVLIEGSQAVEVELLQRDTTPVIKVLQRIDSNSEGFLGYSAALNQSQLSSDGNTYLSPTAVGGLNLLSLQDLKSRWIDTGPFEVLRALPTPETAKLVVRGRLKPFGRDAEDVFVVDVERQRLAPVTGGSRAWDRLEFVPSLQRLGVIKDSAFTLVDELPLGIETDVAEWRGRMIEEAAQRKIQTMTRSASLGYAQVVPSLPMSASPVAESYAAVSARPADTQVEVIGVYESANGRHGSGVHLPGVIDIDVRRSKLPLTLVLTSYEPITWKLHRQPGANIKQVLVSSYHPSTVEDTGKAKVIVINAGYNYQASGRRPLSGDVRSLAGAIDGLFQGTYSGERFSVGDN